MKIKEVTNAKDQLDLLRVIIDNTWTAIRQQADIQAKQKAAQANKPKAPKVPKPQAKAVQPQMAPKPAIQQPARNTLGTPKQVGNKAAPLRSPEEMRMFMNHLKGEKVKTPQMNQNQGVIPDQQPK